MRFMCRLGGCGRDEIRKGGGGSNEKVMCQDVMCGLTSVSGWHISKEEAQKGGVGGYLMLICPC